MPQPPLSPLAPAHKPKLASVAGVRLATAATGMKYKNRADVLLLAFPESATIAGVTTQSATASAPVDWCRPIIANGTARAILINAGNANAFTGIAGKEAVAKCAAAVAAAMDCPADQVLLASTGVIGEVLPHAAITRHVAALTRALDEADSDSTAAWWRGADAIRTTDTFAKATSRQTHIGNTPITITGMAKGSGMIAPNMATTLAFITTDATLPSRLLQSLLPPLVDASFNSISVDSDTSTSDMLILAATATANHPPISQAGDPALSDFKNNLADLLCDLARQVVRDGEGARKFITIHISGAETDLAARRIGLAVANSPLVKTAIAGEDANWGRIVMAVGKAGEAVARDRLTIAIGGIVITEDGTRRPDYAAANIESALAKHLAGDTIDIAIDIGLGTGAARIWTCDLTEGYLKINAAYRS